jgi:hypothetical protein
MVGNYTLRICPKHFVLIIVDQLAEQCHLRSLSSHMFILVCSSRMLTVSFVLIYLKYILLEMHNYIFMENTNGQVLTRKE